MRTLFGLTDIFVFNWIFSDVFGSSVWFARFSGRTLFGFADIFVFNWIFSDVFGSRWFGFRAVVLRVSNLLVWPIGNVFGPFGSFASLGEERYSM